MDLPYNRKVMRACGLSELFLPSRRTFDRRLKNIFIDIKEKITTMGHLFVLEEGLVKPYILATDITLIKAHGKIWHKSSMEKGIVPRSGIDTDMHDGGDIITQRAGYMDTNYTHDIKYWFSSCTFICCRCYNC